MCNLPLASSVVYNTQDEKLYGTVGMARLGVSSFLVTYFSVDLQWFWDWTPELFFI